MFDRLRPWWKLIGFALILVWYFIWLMLDTLFAGKKHHRGMKIRGRFCKAAMNVFNIDLELKGNALKKHGLFISNHRSMLDPMIELSFLDVYILSKAEVGSYPLIGKGARETGVFFVDRLSDNSRKAALQSIEKLLASGKPILVYPEGTTNGQNLTADFRKGAFEVAYNLNVPVTPIMIEYPGPEYYWTDDTLMEYFKKIFSKRGKHRVVVEIGDEIFAESKEALVTKTKEAIDQMIIKTRISRNTPEPVMNQIT